MAAPTFSITAALGKGWQAFKANPGTGILISLAFGFVMMVGSLPDVLLSVNDQEVQSGGMLLLVPAILLQVALCVGLIWNGLHAAAGKGLSAGRIFMLKRSLPMIGALILVLGATMLGTLLLVIPGLIVGTRLSLTPYFIADQDMGVTAAIGASWGVTRGNVLRLIGFNLLHYPAMFACLLTLGLGLFVWPTVYWVAMADIYHQLAKTPARSDGQLAVTGAE